MRIYDVSVPLSTTTPTYPGDPGIEIKSWTTLAQGDPANVSLLHFGAHSGTHVDAPAHFILDAARVDSLPLDILIGRASVVEVPPSVSMIDEQFVTANCPQETKRILFKTRNSLFWHDSPLRFRTDYTHLGESAAQTLVDLGVRLVGSDYLSVEKFQSSDFATHRILLSNEVVILEGLDLTDVPAGEYELICLPLKLADGTGDGAPARTVLRTLS